MSVFLKVRIVAVLIPLLAMPASTAVAQRNLRDIPDPSPEGQLKTFRVADGFAVNLYASDPVVTKPIQIAFDERGRLWVASSRVYPQIRPGQPEDDRVLILEDRDRDGTAEHVTVFARGLLMPTGVLPGDGGAYVALGNELVHFADRDGDGVADERRVVLSGFGLEDTHHIFHSLRWGPDGKMYFNQSYYIQSHIETPYGPRRLDGGGVWQYDPVTGRLEIFVRGMVNSWGHRWDTFGQSFCTDGAFGEGINYVFPGSTFVASPGTVRKLRGLNPGNPKHAGLERLTGEHFPEAWRDRWITADFRANRINSFTVTEDGRSSGYAGRKRDDLLSSTHVAFRPVDMTMGPDGAIYFADWYNPIIQHGEVNFKDERRDHVHGRIWRVAVAGKPALK
ncbi:MAG: PVC-type heme-binding CxxCH protein, partial [Planctomycetota bacterium]